jgi:hypothetical protein
LFVSGRRAFFLQPLNLIEDGKNHVAREKTEKRKGVGDEEYVRAGVVRWNS